MSASVTSLCNRALLAIGNRTRIQSLNDGTLEADACAQLFSPTYEALARTAPWNCLRKQETLSVFKAAQGTPENPQGTTSLLPPSPWLYAYALPSDCLDVRFISPSINNGTGSGVPLTGVNNLVGSTWSPGAQIPFVVAADTDAGGNPLQVILCNMSQAQAVYTVNQPNPVAWDALFQEAMVSSLGAYLITPLSMEPGMLDRLTKRADIAIAQARLRDGNEGVTVMDHVPDWIRARGGSAATSLGPSRDYAGYGSMFWPGGTA